MIQKKLIQKLLIIFFLAFAHFSFAKSLKIYKHVDRKGVTHYSSKKPAVKGYKILNLRCPECAWKNKVDWYNTPLVKNKFESEIQAAATKWKIEPSLIKAVIHAESSFKADVQSSAGAQGLMQLMPATQKIYAVTNPYDAKQNIQGGTELLKHLLKKYNNNLKLSLAAYNAGETAVKKYGNTVPPYPETVNYIERVTILEKRYKQKNL